MEIKHNQYPGSIVYHCMDDILLFDSNIDIFERMLEEVRKVLPHWRLQIPLEKMQRGGSIKKWVYRKLKN